MKSEHKRKTTALLGERRSFLEKEDFQAARGLPFALSANSGFPAMAWLGLLTGFCFDENNHSACGCGCFTLFHLQFNAYKIPERWDPLPHPTLTIYVWEYRRKSVNEKTRDWSEAKGLAKPLLISVDSQDDHLLHGKPTSSLPLELPPRIQTLSS